MFDSIKRFFDANLTAAAEASSPAQQDRAYKLALAALLIEMTRADHDVKGIERDAVADAVRRAFELNASETEELLALAEKEADKATSLYEFTQLINHHFDPEQKAYFVELLWHVALADGEIDKYEEYLVRKVADLIHVPHRMYIRAKHRAITATSQA
ncbi:MAG: TerB family tellurite resistance protein [Gammaproteobacteria bacterium]|nr:MAG: TerB family tellurite resistance protein [Gammaproteobacteria bacterium]